MIPWTRPCDWRQSECLSITPPRYKVMLISPASKIVGPRRGHLRHRLQGNTNLGPPTTTCEVSPRPQQRRNMALATNLLTGS